MYAKIKGYEKRHKEEAPEDREGEETGEAREEEQIACWTTPLGRASSMPREGSGPEELPPAAH